MKSKNLDIQFFKFLYSCVIVIYHLAGSTAISCPGGYCGVEFFLLSAGVFLFLSFDKEEQLGKLRTPGQYVIRRFWRFLPWSAAGFSLTVVVDRMLTGDPASLREWSNCFASDVWEVLMVKGNGMNNDQLLVNGPAWTLSAMLIVGFILWTLLYYYKDLFLNLILPLSLITGFGYWMHLPSADTERWIGFTTFGTFRTWLIMGLSYYCVILGKKLSGMPLNRKGKLVLTSMEVLIHIFALTVMFTRAQRYDQWLVTILFAGAIAIALSGHSYLAMLMEHSKTINLLGELSMSLYLVHTAVICFVRSKFDISAWSWQELLPVFAVVFILALFFDYGTKVLIKLVSAGWKRLMADLTET